MGLVSLVIDILTLSTGAAVARRLTGYSAKEFVLSRLPDRAILRGATASFFNVGEAIVFSIVKYSEVVRVSRELKLKEREQQDSKKD